MFTKTLSLAVAALTLSAIVNAQAQPLSSNKQFEDKIVKSTTPIIIDVWSPECPACRKFKPVFERVAQGTLSTHIDFYTLNFLESEELMNIINAYGVDRIPARLYFDAGKLIAHETGFITEKAFVQEIHAKFKF